MSVLTASRKGQMVFAAPSKGTPPMDGAGAAHFCRKVQWVAPEPIAGIDRPRCVIGYRRSTQPAYSARLSFAECQTAFLVESVMSLI
jgi:hypothetical protein